MGLVIHMANAPVKSVTCFRVANPEKTVEQATRDPAHAERSAIFISMSINQLNRSLAELLEKNEVRKRTHPSRCPKCRSRHLVISEVYTGSFDWEQFPDGSLDVAGWNTCRESGESVWAECWECNYRWRLRGVSQITDLPNHPDHLDNKEEG